MIEYDLDKYVRTATLFPQINIASASNYYESLPTREVSRKHPLLLSKGPFIFAFKKELQDFLAHADEKHKLCPDSKDYKKEQRKTYSKELQSFGRAFARDGGETSLYIEDAWLEDLSPDKEDDPYSLASILKTIPVGDRPKYEETLYRVVEKRGDLQISPPYLERTLRGFSESFVSSAQNRLLHYYLCTTLETTGVKRIDATSLAEPFYNVRGLSTQNFSLAIKVFDMLGIGSSVMRMTDVELLELKEREAMINFIKMYLQLINEAAKIEHNERRLYWEYVKERFKVGYVPFVEALKSIAPFTLLTSMADSLPPLEKCVAAGIIYGSEHIVERAFRKRIDVDKKPLLALKKLILEQYSKKLDNSAKMILEGDHPLTEDDFILRDSRRNAQPRYWMRRW
jgi:hypothetical protein